MGLTNVRRSVAEHIRDGSTPTKDELAQWLEAIPEQPPSLLEAVREMEKRVAEVAEIARKAHAGTITVADHMLLGELSWTYMPELIGRLKDVESWASAVRELQARPVECDNCNKPLGETPVCDECYCSRGQDAEDEKERLELELGRLRNGCDEHPEAICGTCGACDEHKELVACFACANKGTAVARPTADLKRIATAIRSLYRREFSQISKAERNEIKAIAAELESLGSPETVQAQPSADLEGIAQEMTEAMYLCESLPPGEKQTELIIALESIRTKLRSHRPEFPAAIEGVVEVARQLEGLRVLIEGDWECNMLTKEIGALLTQLRAALEQGEGAEPRYELCDTCTKWVMCAGAGRSKQTCDGHTGPTPKPVKPVYTDEPATEPAAGELLPCPMPGCGGAARTQAGKEQGYANDESRYVACSTDGCLLGEESEVRYPPWLSVALWQSLPRPPYAATPADGEPQCYELEEWIADNTQCVVCGKMATYHDGLIYHQCAKPRRSDASTQQGPAPSVEVVELFRAWIVEHPRLGKITKETLSGWCEQFSRATGPAKVWVQVVIQDSVQVHVTTTPPLHAGSGQKHQSGAWWFEEIVHGAEQGEPSEDLARGVRVAEEALVKLAELKAERDALQTTASWYRTRYDLAQIYINKHFGGMDEGASVEDVLRRIKAERGALQARLDNPGRTQFCAGCVELTEKRDALGWDVRVANEAREKAEARVAELEAELQAIADGAPSPDEVCRVLHGAVKQYREDHPDDTEHPMDQLHREAREGLQDVSARLDAHPTPGSPAETDEGCPCEGCADRSCVWKNAKECQDNSKQNIGHCRELDTYRAARMPCNGCGKLPYVGTFERKGLIGCRNNAACSMRWYTPGAWLAEHSKQPARPFDSAPLDDRMAGVEERLDTLEENTHSPCDGEAHHGNRLAEVDRRLSALEKRRK